MSGGGWSLLGFVPGLSKVLLGLSDGFRMPVSPGQIGFLEWWLEGLLLVQLSVSH